MIDLPAPTSASDNSPAAQYFAQSYQAFLAAKSLDGEWLQRYYHMPQGILRLIFARSEMVPLISPALDHRALAEPCPAALTVLCWDGHDSYNGLPPAPWQKDMGNAQNHISHYADGRYQMIYQTVDSSFSMYDGQSRLALFCVKDYTRIPYYETASPLRYILNWWTKYQDLVMVHGAAIGIAGQGVLMVGRGGSGKSTTALACLLSGMDYVGDDYVLAGTTRVPEVCSLFNTAKLSPHSLAMLARYNTRLDPVTGIDQEKSVVFLHQSLPERMRWDMKLKAIFIPQLTAQAVSRLVPASSAAALRASAPSTVLQLPGSGSTVLSKLGRLAASVPSYALEIGADWPLLPDLIRDFLTRRPAVQEDTL